MNFSWVVPGKLAGCMGPVFREELLYLQRQGIGAIVRMERQTIPGAVIGLVDMAEYVPDFHPPTPSQIDHILDFIHRQVEGGIPVAVSCQAGLGRTGTVLACYLVREGYSAGAALERVRSLRPRSVEGTLQQDFVYSYEERLRASPDSTL